MSLGKIYLLPNVLHEGDQGLKAIPAYVLDAIKDCTVFFTENEKMSRRFFKRLWKEMVIDDYKWYGIQKTEKSHITALLGHLKAGENIGIISDAGCPGIADPGQILIEAAQAIGAIIRPIVGPNSILLALMASGMNGQQFKFLGYLPIDSAARKKAILDLEQDSIQQRCTQIFIETPYRNNALIHDVLSICKPDTRFCIAADITSEIESIHTKTVKDWKKKSINIHKRPAIFLLLGTR